MEAVQTARHPQDATPTFESVWAGLQEVRQILKENAEREKKSSEEWEKQRKEYAENLKETERVLKEQSKSINEKIGSLTNLFGDVTEAMIAPKICEKFEDFGFSFLRANPNVRFNDRPNDLSFEVDIMLENGEKAMLIEAKTKLTLERVDKHIRRLEKMHKYANLHGDKRIFLGAVAGIVVTDEIRDYALSRGFYFIEYAGENFYITSPAGKPKEW
jgi:hypothetical protein